MDLADIGNTKRSGELAQHAIRFAYGEGSHCGSEALRLQVIRAV